MKLNNFMILGAVSFLAAGIVCAGPIKVHTIGDSTMADYDENATVTRGWCQYLQQFLNSDSITVDNRGKGGADTKSFYRDAARWPSVKQELTRGDYVFIQFAHNDEKNEGMDGDSLKAYYEKTSDATSAAAVDLRGTVPQGVYKQTLIKYVNETREAGCTPVLVSPICRMYFDNGTIRRNGRHDLGDKFSVLTTDGVKTGQSVPEDNHTMDYVYVMKSVADSMKVDYIDLMTATKKLFESYGDSKCHTLLSDGNGSTHLNTTGATLIARLCAENMKEQGILAKDVEISSDLSVSPSVADLGKAYTGQTLIKEFTLSGFSLTPADGTIAVTSDQGVEVSTDKQTWSNNAAVGYSDGTLVQNFYARIALGKAGEVHSVIKVAWGDKIINIPVTATAISLNDGTDVTAYWRLEKDDQCQLTGPATVLPEEYAGMYVSGYSNPNKDAVWPEGTGYDATRKMQRDLIIGDVWPDGDIDENPDRYIQFAVTPSKGTALNVDSISLYICGAGGNGMMCHVNYSTDPNFSNQHTFYAPVKMVANTITEAVAQPVISLSDQDTLRVRIYPWYNGTASKKTICISDVIIHGKAVETSGIIAVKDDDSMKDDSILSKDVWVNLLGQQVTEPRHGIYINNGKKYIIK